MKKLKKPKLNNSVKDSLSLGKVELSTKTKNECATGGDEYVTQGCKGDKCCNGAGGCC
jgi:hypothetical protein